MKTCETCNGKGEAFFSCCTGEVVTDDYQMCPECREHLGEEKCPDCDGTGKVDDDFDEFTPAGPDLQARAEDYYDAKRRGEL